LINRETSGAKQLDSKQSQKINRAYKRREKNDKLIDARVEREVKILNKARAESRRQARATFGRGGISPDADKLRRRLNQYAPLTPEDEARIRDAFKSAEQDGGKKIRAEYKRQLSKVQITSLPSAQRADFRNRLRKATLAVERDEGTRQTTLDEV